MKRLLSAFVAVALALGVLAPRAASVMAGNVYGGWCSTCRTDRRSGHDFTHGYGRRRSSRRRSSGGSSGGAAMGNAFGAMIDGFFKGIQEAQEAQARAARLAAEQRRRAEIARRQRLERLRRERIRRARRMRIDWDRREIEMGERLVGVFDVFVDSSVVDLRPDPLPGGTSFFGTGGSPGQDIFEDSSLVDLRHRADPQRALEGQLRMNPAFLQAQAQRAAATDAFATANYGAVPIASLPTPRRIKPFKERLKDLAKVLADDVLGESLKSAGPYGRMIEGVRNVRGIMTGAAEDVVPQVLDPQMYRGLGSPGSYDFGEKEAKVGRIPLDTLRKATGDKSLKQETLYKKFRALVLGSEGK